MIENLQAELAELALDLAIMRQGSEIERSLAVMHAAQPSANLYAASEAEARALSSPREAADDAAVYLQHGEPVAVRVLPDRAALSRNGTDGRQGTNPNATAEAYALAHPYPNGRWG